MEKTESRKYKNKVKQILKKAGIPVATGTEIETADFGLNEFRKTGLSLILRVNEPQYCSKWLILLPGQKCPYHHHKSKKETFFIHRGKVLLKVGNKKHLLKEGEQITLQPGQGHEFSSKKGAIVEEVSMHDKNSDSYFTDKRIIRDTKIER